MNRVRALRRELFDIRPGEHLRTWFMFFYLLCVLFAYYVLKPVSRSMFLTKFNIDKLPSLYMLIAVFGGLFAYLYSKLAARSSLQTAVFWTLSVSVGSLVAMWMFIGLPWMVYVLNIWVSMFAIVLVSQGWLVASNLFDAREAKRLYPLLAMGMVLGAAFGGEFTNRTALLVGTRNLLLASAGMVVLAYVAVRLAILPAREKVSHARAAESGGDFSFRQMTSDIRRVRHLQVIVGLMMVMYLVDTLVEYQFQVTARQVYRGDQLTAFFGQFYGLYLNLTEFVFQLFLTAAVVKRFGVGGTLQISPAGVLLTSVATVMAPGVTSAGAVRLTEASTRYTLNRTGMELLYMPLPAVLRNRTKAFIDICVDRVSRGLGGFLLLLLTATFLHLGVKEIAMVTMALCIPWMYFSYLARKEYVSTIRKRFAARRLDFETVRVSVHDPATAGLLETTAAGDNPRQAAYALSLLAEAPEYDIRRLLRRLSADCAPEVCRKVYEIAAKLKWDGLVEGARGRPGGLAYLLAVSPERRDLARELLDDADPARAREAIEALREEADLVGELIAPEWLEENARSDDARRRALAATAIGIRGDEGTELLHRLLADPDPETAGAAVRAAGALRGRPYILGLINALGNARLRGDAIAALAAYGPSIAGSLADAMTDTALPARVRQQVPRVLKNIPDQRSVDVLLGRVDHADVSIRYSVLKALNRLRETAPHLCFDHASVMRQILNEALHYYELNAALEPFRDRRDGNYGASRLLALSIEERLKYTLERLFRLLGLRYPPKEIYSAYVAVARQHGDSATAALEFLDNVLERDLKRILLPLLDAPEHILDHGRELFGVEVRTAEEAVRELIRSGDPWLVSCAIAAAAELQFRSLAPEIALAAKEAAEEVGEVARSAEVALAA